MSRNGSTGFLDFGDGKYKFRLGFAELEELQDLTGYGLERSIYRLRAGEWGVGEVRESIRIGLIGGGCEPIKALTLVERYVEKIPDWLRNKQLAFVILSEALQGPVEDAPKKPKAKRKTKTRSPTGVGVSQKSTNQDQPSD